MSARVGEIVTIAYDKRTPGSMKSNWLFIRKWFYKIFIFRKNEDRQYAENIHMGYWKNC